MKEYRCYIPFFANEANINYHFKDPKKCLELEIKFCDDVTEDIVNLINQGLIGPYEEPYIKYLNSVLEQREKSIEYLSRVQ